MKTSLSENNVINSSEMENVAENDSTDEIVDSEDELADFCAQFFGQNPAIESTYL